MGVIDYVADAKAFLDTLFSITKLCAVVSFPSKHWFRTPFRRIRYRIHRRPFYFYDKIKIRELVMKAGFKEIEIKKIPGTGMDYHVCFKR